MKNSIKITALLIMILVFNACNPNKDITGIWKYKDNADEDVYYSFIFFNNDGTFEDMMLYNGYQHDVTGTYELDTVKDILIMKRKTLTKIEFL